MYAVFWAPFVAMWEKLRWLLAGLVGSGAAGVAGAYWLGRKRGR